MDNATAGFLSIVAVALVAISTLVGSVVGCATGQVWWHGGLWAGGGTLVLCTVLFAALILMSRYG